MTKKRCVEGDEEVAQVVQEKLGISEEETYDALKRMAEEKED